MENWLVIKHNNLIEAKYDLNLNEQKIVLYAVSKIDRSQEKFNILEVDVREFTKLIGTTSERYSEIREIARSLRKKEIIINTEKDELITGWISSIKYIKATGKIKLEFSENLMPYLLQLKELYTKYEIKNVMYLRSKYSIRIYELLKQYETIGKRDFQLDDFKKKIGCYGKYNDFRNLKRNVLESAKEEVCEYTDISFEYEQITEGRKVTGIKFTIQSKKDRNEYLIDEIYTNREIEDIKIKSGLKHEKFNPNQIMQLYEIACRKTESGDISPYEYIRINYRHMINKGTARNKFGYLKKALEEDYANAAAQIQLNFLIESEVIA